MYQHSIGRIKTEDDFLYGQSFVPFTDLFHFSEAICHR